MGKVRQKSRGLRKSYCTAAQQDLKAPPPEAAAQEESNGNGNQQQLPSSTFQTQSSSLEAAAQDFGGLVHNPPSCVVCPSSTDGISKLVKIANNKKLTVAARGNGHSVHGQSQALNGIVIDMLNLPNNTIQVVLDHAPPSTQDDHHHNLPFPSSSYVEVSAGELWIDVLKETLKHGLAPRSWTDYLYLTVGGTLSNAGVSGQAFKHGPQISNVLQLEVVTGRGDITICSPKRNSELFYAALGGLGQFGIITRAWIQLEVAPQRARYMRFLYADFEAFKRDMENLISRPDDDLVDYLEGIVVPKTDDPHQGWNSVPFQGQRIDPRLIPEDPTPVLYCIEIAKYYNQHEAMLVEEHLASLLGSLSYLPNLAFSIDLTYFEFLNRVRLVEETLRKVQQWDVPHPWLNLFVPRSKISRFNDLVFKDIVRKGVNGPMLMYPLNRSKWETKSSAVIPDESIFYIIGLLRSVVDQSQPLEVHLEQNADILRKCESNSLGVKQFFPHYHTETEWKQHFGDSWGRFTSNKLKYDPNAVLAPGQRIFSRSKVVATNRKPKQENTILIFTLEDAAAAR